MRYMYLPFGDNNLGWSTSSPHSSTPRCALVNHFFRSMGPTTLDSFSYKRNLPVSPRPVFPSPSPASASLDTTTSKQNKKSDEMKSEGGIRRGKGRGKG